MNSASTDGAAAVAVEPEGFITAGGQRLLLRVITPDDAPALVRFHERLSPSSAYHRFFSFHPHLTPQEVERFTHVDGVDRLALVAEHAGELVAVARYDRLGEAACAEVAFIVADTWQGRGIASLMLQMLARQARHAGISTLLAEVLLDNRAMMRVFTASGLGVTVRAVGGTFEVQMALDAPVPATPVPTTTPG